MSDDEEQTLSNAIVVEYCPHCTLPPEYCEYGPTYDKCKPWLLKNHPELFGKVKVEAKEGDEGTKEITDDMEDLDVDDEGDDDAPKKKSKRGGKGSKAKGAEKEEVKTVNPKDQYIHISKSQRNKRKFITVVKGVETFGLKPKDVAQKCAKKFACSGSVGKAPDGVSEVSIQGDVMMDLPSFFRDDYKIPGDRIFFKNGAKLTKAP